MKEITPTISQLRMLASIRGNEWMIRRDAMQSIALAALEVPEKASLNVSVEDFYELRPESFTDADGIGHIHIHSMLVAQSPAIYEKLGLVTRYETIIAEASAMIADGAKGLLFHTNSPGGTVAGNIEAANFIASIKIPTAAHCHGLACSAAYKLISGCNAIFAGDTAEVGNIGTILSWMDCDEFWRMNGIEFKALVSEGADLKSTGHLEPDEVQVAFLQERINESGKQFREHVAKGRKKAGAELDDEVWRAGWYSGKKAGQLGLVDQIGTAEQARQWLISKA